MGDKIQWSRQEEVALTWVHPGQEFSHRLITQKLHGSSISFHITTYMPRFDVMVEGDGVHEVILYCLHGWSRQIVEATGEEHAFKPGDAMYLPKTTATAISSARPGSSSPSAPIPPRKRGSCDPGDSHDPPPFALRGLLWAELTRVELAAKRDAGALVIVPTGAIEQHSDFLPVETDSLLAAAISQRAVARMTAAEVVVAPVVATGFSPHHLSLAGTISLRLETYLALLTDTARSILDAGFPRLLFVNGHGGNSAPLRALCGQLVTDGLPAGMVDYMTPGETAWRAALKGALPRSGHACELETALVMALSPDRPRSGQAEDRPCPQRPDRKGRRGLRRLGAR